MQGREAVTDKERTPTEFRKFAVRWTRNHFAPGRACLLAGRLQTLATTGSISQSRLSNNNQQSLVQWTCN